MSSPLVLQVSDASFDADVLKSNIPVLLDFWAEWCGPCRALSPLVDQLAEEYQGKLKVCKLNVDQNPDTAASHGVRGIPTLLIIKGGEVVDRAVGMLPKPELQKLIDRHV